MDPHPGRHRARERHAADARERHRDVRRAPRPLGGRHRLVLGRRGAGPRDRVHRSIRRRRRSFAGTRMGDLVHAGHDQPRASVRRPVGRTHPRGGRRRLGRGGRRDPPGDVRRAPRPHRSARERARHPGGASAPHRGHLPADGDRDRRRDHGLREARRDLGADLQRVRPRCGGGPAGRRPHPGGDHRRRIPAEGLARRDEGGGRPRRSNRWTACATSWCGTAFRTIRRR